MFSVKRERDLRMFAHPLSRSTLFTSRDKSARADTTKPSKVQPIPARYTQGMRFGLSVVRATTDERVSKTSPNRALLLTTTKGVHMRPTVQFSNIMRYAQGGIVMSHDSLYLVRCPRSDRVKQTGTAPAAARLRRGRKVALASISTLLDKTESACRKVAPYATRPSGPNRYPKRYVRLDMHQGDVPDVTRWSDTSPRSGYRSSDNSKLLRPHPVTVEAD